VQESQLTWLYATGWQHVWQPPTDPPQESQDLKAKPESQDLLGFHFIQTLL